MFGRKVETELDLTRSTLFGHEVRDVKDPVIVWNMILGIRNSNMFRLVSVNRVKEEDDQYVINRKLRDPYVAGTVDGGHNRAIAHLIESAPLRVQVLRKAVNVEYDQHDLRESTIDYDNRRSFDGMPLQEGNRVVKNAALEEHYGIKPYTQMPSEEDLAYMQDRMSQIRAEM